MKWDLKAMILKNKTRLKHYQLPIVIDDMTGKDTYDQSRY